jgi:hypothetical protein
MRALFFAPREKSRHILRLVWTAACRLYAASVTAEGLATANMLINTEAMRFEPRQAPY